MKQGIDCPEVTVAFLCHDGLGSYLLAKGSAGARDENGCWDGGGGGLDLGATVEDTLKKRDQRRILCRCDSLRIPWFSRCSSST